MIQIGKSVNRCGVRCSLAVCYTDGYTDGYTDFTPMVTPIKRPRRQTAEVAMLKCRLNYACTSAKQRKNSTNTIMSETQSNDGKFWVVHDPYVYAVIRAEERPISAISKPFETWEEAIKLADEMQEKRNNQQQQQQIENE